MRTRGQVAYLLLAMCLSFVIISPNVIATRGNLYTDSIVTCNGKTYGRHNGHWHEAKQNVKGDWYAAYPNDEIPYNPCDSSFEPTGGSAKHDENATSNESLTTDSAQPANTSESTTQRIGGPRLEEQKKNETIELKVWIDNSDNPIVFSNNTYTAKSRNYWQKGLNLTYQLSSENVSLKIEKNGEQIDEPIELDEGDNKIKLIVESDSGEEAAFEINAKRENLLISLITLVVVCMMSTIILGVPAIAIKVYIIDQKKKKNNNKKIPVQKFLKSLLKKDNSIKILIPLYYVAMKKKQHKKASNYLSYWIAIWLITIISVVVFFMSSPVESGNNVNPVSSPSATFTIEIVELNDSGAMTNESENEPDTSLNNNIMSGIIIAEATNARYSRNEYEPNRDVGSGCNIRARILQQTSLVAVKTSSNGCTVIYGSWVDPYTGETLTGNPYQGDDGMNNDLDIDHIIPLKYVNSHGGSEWSYEQKRSYGSSLSAMENGVYVAVSASENRKKSDSGPSEYYPPNESYKCEYARKWRDIARGYGISLSLSDYNIIQNILVKCAS